MAPVRPRHRFDDRGLLAVFANADDEAFVAPFHRRGSYEGLRWAGGGTGASLSAKAGKSAASTSMKAATSGHLLRARSRPAAAAAARPDAVVGIVICLRLPPAASKGKTNSGERQDLRPTPCP